MTDIRITAGSCGDGSARYEAGVFAMPNGDLRGVEDLTSLDREDEPAPRPHWSGPLLRGIKEALASTAPLPRPFGLAASVVGLGLGAVEGSMRSPVRLRATFSDGATALMLIEAALAALVERDREIIRLAALRGARATAGEAPAPVALPQAEGSDSGPGVTAMFEYEKRKGRLRRVATVKDPGKA